MSDYISWSEISQVCVWPLCNTCVSHIHVHTFFPWWATSIPFRLLSITDSHLAMKYNCSNLLHHLVLFGFSNRRRLRWRSKMICLAWTLYTTHNNFNQNTHLKFCRMCQHIIQKPLHVLEVGSFKFLDNVVDCACEGILLSGIVWSNMTKWYPKKYN